MRPSRAPHKLAGLFPLLLMLSGAFGQPAQAQGGPVDSDLAHGRVSVLEDGRRVVSLDAQGAHSGLVTLNFFLNPDGTIASGTFAVVVASAATLNEDGTVSTGAHAEEQGDSAEPHHDRMRLVSRGVVSGTITGGQVSQGAAGALVLSGLQLTVTTGTLEFDNAIGWGVVDADLNKHDAQGVLRLVL